MDVAPLIADVGLLDTLSRWWLSFANTLQAVWADPWAHNNITTTVPLLTTIALVVATVTMVTLERLFPYRKGLPFLRHHFWLDFFWYTIFQSYILQIVIFTGIIAPLKGIWDPNGEGYLSHWPLWALVAFFFVTHDLYIYWFHRAQHSFKFLWKTHEAHHSAIDVDWLAGSRSHPIEILINQTIEFLPIIVLLDAHTAALVVPIKALLDAVWGQFIHSNINVRLGKLNYVINGPEMHQWHHAEATEIYFKNYATKLALWDWLFGTAYLPGHKPERYGLPYSYPRDYFGQVVFLFRRFDPNANPLERWPGWVRRLLGWAPVTFPMPVAEPLPPAQQPAEVVVPAADPTPQPELEPQTA